MQASELQASVKLRFLVQFPRGMGNSKLSLMGGCHTDNTQGAGSTQLRGCASREQRETLPLLAALFQLVKPAPHF